jgi:hypothetical protein
MGIVSRILEIMYVRRVISFHVPAC